MGKVHETVEPQAPKAGSTAGAVYRYGAHVGWVRAARSAWYRRADWYVAYNAAGVRVGWGNTVDEAVATLA